MEFVHELQFPTGFSHTGELKIVDRRVALITKEADPQLLELFQVLNPYEWKQFFLIKNNLYFEDRSVNESPIQESFVDHIVKNVHLHSASMESRSGLQRAVLGASFSRNLPQIGVPDVAITPSGHLNQVDPVLVVEVAYSVPLKITLEKVQQYFLTIPCVQAAIIIDIDYPWRELHGTPFYDPENGKMVLFYYLRGDGENIMTLDRVISFGNNPIVGDDVGNIVNLTGVAEADIEGVVEGQDNRPCDTEGAYTLTVSNEILYFGEPVVGEAHHEDVAVANPLYQEIIDAIEHGPQPGPVPDLLLDLFTMKQRCIQHGVHRVNVMRAREFGIPFNQLPPLPF